MANENPKKDLYLDVRQRILDKVPEVKHVLLFNNQFDRDTEEEAFTYPCVFIEFLQLIHSGVASNQQKSDIQIRLHVGYESLKTEDLGLLDLVQSVHLAVQGFSGQLFSGLQRIEERQDIDHDNVQVWQIDYETNLTDCVTDPKANLKSFTIANLEIDKDLDIDNDIVRTGDGDFTT